MSFSTAATDPARQPGLSGLLAKLHSIQIGGAGRGAIRRRDLTYVFNNLASLTTNGVPLARALATLVEERSLRRYHTVLDKIRRGVESGASFSAALAEFP